MKRFVDHSVDKLAVKALVALLGPREAARQAGLPAGTVLRWCQIHKWKKADRIFKTTGINGDKPVKDAAQLLTETMQKLREESTVDLAQFTANAAKQASKLKNPLSKARNVRDVASVYGTLYPPEKPDEMIEGAILIGTMKVKDNTQEMLAATTPQTLEAEIVP